MPKTVPADDFEAKSFEFQGERYYVRDKFKVARFLRALNDAPVDAIELVLEDESFEKFLDLEISMDDLKEFLEKLSNVMAGAPSKN